MQAQCAYFIGNRKKANLSRLLGIALFLFIILMTGTMPSCVAAALTIIWRQALPVDLSRLRNYDLVVVIDKSKSMAVVDCQGTGTDLGSQSGCLIESSQPPISRWE